MATIAQSVLAPHAAHKEERYLATDPVGSVGTYTPERCARSARGGGACGVIL